jgi:hypothetical protein
MTQRPLYLHINRHFATRAVLLGLDAEDRATEPTFVIYLANLSTLAHFAAAAAGFVMARAAQRAVDRVVDKGLDMAQRAAQQFRSSMRSKFRAELDAPSTGVSSVDYDLVTAQADEFIPALLSASSALSLEELDAALSAGERAASTFLKNDLHFPDHEATRVSRLITEDMRNAIAHERVPGKTNGDR